MPMTKTTRDIGVPLAEYPHRQDTSTLRDAFAAQQACFAIGLFLMAGTRWGFEVIPIGAASKAIPYDSMQFSTGEFFKHGIPMSIILLIVLGVAMVTLWPMLGMPILTDK